MNFSISLEIRENDLGHRSGIEGLDFLKRFGLSDTGPQPQVRESHRFSKDDKTETDARNRAECHEEFARSWFESPVENHNCREISLEWLVAGELVDRWPATHPARHLILNLTADRVRELFVRSCFEELRGRIAELESAATAIS